MFGWSHASSFRVSSSEPHCARGRDNGAPGVREQYSSEAGGRYYAAFLLDPDDNNVEAVHREF